MSQLDVVIVGTNAGSLVAIDKNGKKRKDYSLANGAGITHNSIVNNGILYFGDSNNKLHAVDLNTGEELWQIDSAGHAFVNTPSIAGDTLYYASNTDFQAVDPATGEPKWQIHLGFTNKNNFTGVAQVSSWGMTIFENTAWFGTSYGLYKVEFPDNDNDPGTGTLVVDTSEYGRVFSIPAIYQHSVPTPTNTIWFATPRTSHPTKKSALWVVGMVDGDTYNDKPQFAGEEGFWYATPNLTEHGVVVNTHNHLGDNWGVAKVTVNSNDKSATYAYDWFTDLPGIGNGDVGNTPVIAEDVIYIPGEKLFALSVTGDANHKPQHYWETETPGGYRYGTPLIREDRIYVGVQGALSALDISDGSECWRYPFPRVPGLTTPILAQIEE